MKAASMSPRLPSALGRSGLRRLGISRCVSGTFVSDVLLTGLLVVCLGTWLPLAAQTATSSAPQTTSQQPAPSTLPNAPGTPAPQKPASPPPAAPVTAPPATPAVQQPATPPAPSSDQEPELATPGDEEGTYTLKTNVNEVNLTFTVTDHHGHFINNLQQQDFALLDDQRAPAQVYSFTQQTNQPLRVGLVIDASTSIRARFKLDRKSVV